MELSASLVLVTGIVAWLLLAGLLPVRRLLILGLSMSILNLTWLVPRGIGQAAGVLGAVTISVCVARAWSAGESPRAVPGVLRLPLFAGLTGLVLSPAALDPRDAALVSTGVVLMGGLLLASVRSIDGRQITDAAFWSTTVAMVPSLILIALAIGQTNYSGRALGIFGNPNTLGMVSALWFALALTRRRSWAAVLPLSFSAIVLSGSRGAFIASCAALLTWLWLGGVSRGRMSDGQLMLLRAAMTVLTLDLAFVAVGYFESGRVSSAGSGLARISESGRLALLEHAWLRFLERPLTGWGLGLEQVDGISHPHTLPMTLGFQLGVFGVGLAAAAVLILLRGLRFGSPGLAALSTYALVAMLAESWLFGAGSFVAWAFWFGFGGLFTSLAEKGRSGGTCSAFASAISWPSTDTDAVNSFSLPRDRFARGGGGPALSGPGWQAR